MLWPQKAGDGPVWGAYSSHQVWSVTVLEIDHIYLWPISVLFLYLRVHYRTCKIPESWLRTVQKILYIIHVDGQSALAAIVLSYKSTCSMPCLPWIVMGSWRAHTMKQAILNSIFHQYAKWVNFVVKLFQWQCKLLPSTLIIYLWFSRTFTAVLETSTQTLTSARRSWDNRPNMTFLASYTDWLSYILFEVFALQYLTKWRDMLCMAHDYR